jgi:hypothetical protein
MYNRSFSAFLRNFSERKIFLKFKKPRKTMQFYRFDMGAAAERQKKLPAKPEA